MNRKVEVKELTLSALSYDIDYDEWPDKAFEWGWTDGFPVFAPTLERVRALIDYTGREPDDVVGIMAPAERLATIEAIAINCAMAGCKPEYMPVVLAAVEAMCDPRYQLLGSEVSTVSAPTLLMLSGPVVKKLELNYAEAALAGSGNRANGAIARAIRLILWNVGGGKPGGLSKVVLAQPGRWGQLVAERPPDDGNPWGWFHTQSGLKGDVPLSSDESAVSVLPANGGFVFTNFVRAGSNVKANVEAIGGQLGSGYQWVRPGSHILVLNPEAAKMLADAGWSRDDVRQTIWAATYRTVREIKAEHERIEPGLPVTSSRTAYWDKDVDWDDPDFRVHKILSPEHLFVLVAGGFGGGHVSFQFNGGAHSMDGMGMVTKRIDWEWD